MIEMIELQSRNFSDQISRADISAGNVSSGRACPELSGKLPSLEKFIETYANMSDLMTSYKTLLKADLWNIQLAQIAMENAERNLLK